MEPPDASIDQRIAQRLRALRGERGWSLDELARRSAVSRATLSRLENAEVSPTTAVLGRLCSAFGLTMSRLLARLQLPLKKRPSSPASRTPTSGSAGGMHWPSSIPPS